MFSSSVSQYALDDFFNTADEQMSRMASLIPGRDSSFNELNSQFGERFVLNFIIFRNEKQKNEESE